MRAILAALIVTAVVAAAPLCADDAGPALRDPQTAAAPAQPPIDEAPPVVDAGRPIVPADLPAVAPIVGPAVAATYKEQASPLEFRLAAGRKDAKQRAAEASAALASALDSPPIDGAPLVSVRIADGVAVLRVQGRVVAHLDADDAKAAGAPSLESYAGEIETRLYDFVRSQLTRATLQTFVLHLFLSVFIGVLVFLTLRAIRTAFDRWDQSLVDKGGVLRPISVFKVPVLGGEALRGLLAFGLAVGRALAYAGTVLVGTAAILGQFDATRPFLRDVANRAAEPLKDGVGELVSALPRLVLALAVVVALRAALKVAHILLDGVASGRVEWQPLPPSRVPVARALVGAGTLLVAAPLVVAIVFGRFGTPLEVLAIGMGAVVALSAAPVLASAIVGIFVLWRADLRPGDWVDVAGAHGEVASLSLFQIVLVPEEGGTLVVPMLLLAVRPMRRLHREPTCDVVVRVARDKPAPQLIAHLTKAARVAAPDAEVHVVDMAATWVALRVRAPVGHAGLREAVLLAVLTAVDAGDLTLHDGHP